VQRGRKTLGRHGRQALQQGKRESSGLAGAGLRGSEQVAPGEDDGNGLRLDGGGFRVAMLRDGAKQLGQQPEAFEGRAYDISPERSAREGFAFDTGSGRQKVTALEFGERNCAANWAGSANRMRRFDRLENHST
jgi:hypothetical protein